MKVALKQIFGNWTAGFALDKHAVSSVYLGHDEHGHPRFETTRTEAGEAVYQLKYRQDWTQVETLASALATEICIKFNDIGFLVPMPASKPRLRQPVTEVALALGRILERPVFDDLLLKKPSGKQLKDMAGKEEKAEALKGLFSVQDVITNRGQWNVVLVDDLFHTGATVEAASAALNEYPKARGIYVATMTWR